jgi:hypothetical protein
VVFLIPNFLHTDIHSWPAYDKKERFDTSLLYLNTIPKLEAHVDSIATAKALTIGSVDYVVAIESVLENRFYHGFSHFTLNENWIAALVGKLVKEDHACKVQPQLIIQQPNAGCSQQALVMMALLRRKGITYRSVLFAHHYAIEALIDGKWYFFDANMEPFITNEQRLESYWKHNADSLKKYYDGNRFDGPDIDFKFGKNHGVKNGPVNEIPAPRARFFQSATWLLSKILWAFPLLLLFYRPRKGKHPIPA